MKLINVVAAASVIGLWILSVFLEGVVLSVLWDWFIVPLGVTPISVAHAVGICCIVLTTSQFSSPPDSKNENARFHVLSYLFLRPLFALVCGYIVHVA